MNEKLRNMAIELLGDYSRNSRTKKIIDNRISKLVWFLEENKNDNVQIEINNNWSKPPKSSTVRKSLLLGGTTYRYQIWAVIR